MNIKPILSACVAIIWVVCTTVIVLAGIISPIQLLGGGRNASELILNMVLCYTYIAYVMYTIPYARSRWDYKKDSIYVPSHPDIVQIVTLTIMATVFVICVIYAAFK